MRTGGGEVPEPLILWDAEWQQRWEAFWMRVAMSAPSVHNNIELGPAAVSHTIMDEYTALVMETNPFVYRGHDSARSQITREQQESQHLWIADMMVRTIPAAHAKVVTQGLLVGEGRRLFEAAERYGIFIQLNNEVSEAMHWPGRIRFVFEDDGSFVELENMVVIPTDMDSDVESQITASD
jgi:hypothetical protein